MLDFNFNLCVFSYLVVATQRFWLYHPRHPDVPSEHLVESLTAQIVRSEMKTGLKTQLEATP